MTLDALLGGDPVSAARSLLGRSLISEIGGEATSVVLTEVEAYAGSDDPASHAYRGETRRNRSMFGPPGTLYVYRSYGIHWCMNITCGPEGVAQAVLLRSGQPLAGAAVMERRRGRSDHLTDGPGKLCQALGVTGEHDGVDVFAGPIAIGGAAVSGTITAGPRIGITNAEERPWRFVLTPDS